MKKKAIIIAAASAIVAAILIAVFLGRPDYSKDSSVKETDVMTFSECKVISDKIEMAVGDDPFLTVTALPSPEKVKVTCHLDPIALTYQIIPLAEIAMPIVKEELQDKGIPFELDISGMFYKEGEVSSYIRIVTSDLETWQFDDLSDPSDIVLLNNATYQEIYDRVSK